MIFKIFLETIILFLFEIEFCVKMLSLEVLHDEIAQKLQTLEILLIFSHFLMNFQFLLIFFWWVLKKISKKGPNELELMPAFRETWFLSKNLLQSQDSRGGSGSPPYLSWLRSKFWLKNHVSLKADINSNSFGTFSEIFFKNHQKNWRKFKIYQKIAKNERNFQIF